MTIPDLRVIVGRQIGLSADFDGSVRAYGNLSREQQIELTQGMIAYIQQNPAEFSAAQLKTAQDEAPRAARMTPEDQSFDFGAFVDELENGALKIGDSVASIGNGVTNSLNLVGTLLPALVLIAIAIALWPHVARARAAGASPSPSTN